MRMCFVSFCPINEGSCLIDDVRTRCRTLFCAAARRCNCMRGLLRRRRLLPSSSQRRKNAAYRRGWQRDHLPFSLLAEGLAHLPHVQHHLQIFSCESM